MPITIKGATTSRIGRVNALLGTITAALRGTMTGPPGRSGRILTSHGSLASSLRGQTSVPASRNGKVSTTLGSLAAAVRGSTAQTWTVPTLNFTSGQASTQSFAAYAPAGHDFFILSPSSAALPAGVTLDSANKRFVYDGNAGATTVSGIVLLSLDTNAEWANQTVGAFYSHNLTYRDTAKTQLITSTADMLSARAGPSGGTDARMAWDTVNKLSGGGSVKMNMPAANNGAYSGYSIDFSGIASATKAVQKHQFYVRFCFYPDATYLNFFYGSPVTSPGWGGKIAIIECWNSSFDAGEVVLRREGMPGGPFGGYWLKSGGANPGSYGLNWSSPAAVNGQQTIMNFYDAGTPVVTNLNTLQQRYGINYSSRSDSILDPDVIVNAPRLLANRWHVFEAYVDQVNNVIKWWFAPYGLPPTLVMGAMQAGLPAVGTPDGASTNPQPIYTGVQFTNYPNTALAWPAVDTYVAYSEFIASDNPIPFPGGYTLPFPGTQTPTGYPPAGASENH